MGVEESGGVGSECGKSPGPGRRTSAGAAEEARSELGRVELGGVCWSVERGVRIALLCLERVRGGERGRLRESRRSCRDLWSSGRAVYSRE